MRAAILFAMAAVALSSAPLLWHEEMPQNVALPAHHASAQHAAAGSLAEAAGKVAHHHAHAPLHPAH